MRLLGFLSRLQDDERAAFLGAQDLKGGGLEARRYNAVGDLGLEQPRCRLVDDVRDGGEVAVAAGARAQYWWNTARYECKRAPPAAVLAPYSDPAGLQRSLPTVTCTSGQHSAPAGTRVRRA